MFYVIPIKCFGGLVNGSNHYVVIIGMLIYQNIWLDTKNIFICSSVQKLWYFKYKIAEHSNGHFGFILSKGISSALISF